MIRLMGLAAAFAVVLASCSLVNGQKSKVAPWSAYTVESTQPTGLGFTSRLVLAADQLPQYGPSFKSLTLQVTPETPARLHVKISPNGHKRYEVPDNIVARPAAEPGLTASSLMYDVTQPAPQQPFALTVRRKSNKQPIFDTAGHSFLFKDQYIQLTTSVPKDADLYGLGEVTLRTGLLLPRNGSIITLWARDQTAALADANLYGAHPFYLQVNRDGSSHGVFLLNSNGMDVVLSPTSLTYKVLGGLVDLYFLSGPSPEAVVRQYHNVIGHTALPPHWTLGLHQTRWGYRNIEELEEVVANYSAAGLPLTAVWSDIDYMQDRFRSMELDTGRYGAERMREFVNKLHARGQHWIPLVDAGIAAGRLAQGYAAYEEGVKDNIFVKDLTGKADYLGQVWPGLAVFPAYAGNNASIHAWVHRQLRRFYNQVPFDGLWTDMNEAANFCSGIQCELDTNNAESMKWVNTQVPEDGDLLAADLYHKLSTCVLKCDLGDASNKLAYPPYSIHNFKGLDDQDRPLPRDAPLGYKAISPTAVHGVNGPKSYDVHNVYGAAMSRSHHSAMTAITKKRPFILSRSTFPGSGRWVAHWTGDNAANWDNLYYSIAGILNSNMWGIAMTGSDICGFLDTGAGVDPWSGNNKLSDKEYEELCIRWASAGAMYPFSRNHIGYTARAHEFYRWPSVTASAKKAYGLRYRLLNYMYTSLFSAHSKGGTFARPLLFTDPADLGARNATKQWMLGEAVLVSPVITPKTTVIEPYFTAGTWYSAWDWKPLNADKGQAVKLQVPLGDIAVHYRGGAIIPVHSKPALATTDQRFAPLTLVVALPSGATGRTVLPHSLDEACSTARAANAGKLVSCGLVFMDSAADELTVTASNSVQAWYVAVAAADGASGSIISTVVSNNGGAKGKLYIERIAVLGVGSETPSAAGRMGGSNHKAIKATVNGKAVKATYEPSVGVVDIPGLKAVVGEGLNVQWVVPGVESPIILEASDSHDD